ncbi:MAG: hypothetical protein H3C34_19895 [Caldilineaceae bacterium]|nr:hypothetical protein [Caldilineaceae bacterium]
MWHQQLLKPLTLAALLALLYTGPAAAQAGYTQAVPAGATALELAAAESRSAPAIEGDVNAADLSRSAFYLRTARLAMDQPGTDDYFGRSLAFDGTTLAAGVPGADGRGAVLIYTRSGLTWARQAQLGAPGAATGAEFGTAVVLEGDTLLVGAPGAQIGANARQGALYHFTRSGTTWSLQGTITLGDGAADDRFGNRIAISGATAAVAAPGRAAIYIYSLAGNVLLLEETVTAAAVDATTSFGRALALGSDMLVVGDPDKAVDHPRQGAAYVFLRTGGGWSHQQTLTAYDGCSVQDLRECDDGGGEMFGDALALDGTTLVVGAWGEDVAIGDQGTVYAFTRAGAMWSQSGPRVTAPDALMGDYFGRSVAIHGDTLVAGAWNDAINSDSVGEGSAYVMERNGEGWTLVAKLVSPEGTPGANFGTHVAVHGHTAVVSAYLQPSGDLEAAGAGAVHIYEPAIWDDLTALAADNGAPGDDFGRSVALDGDTQVVGAPYRDVDGRPDQGAAYVFVRSGAAWVQRAMLTAPNGGAGDAFGMSVAVDGPYLAIGAPYWSGNGKTLQGAVYTFVRVGATWTPLGTPLVAANEQAFQLYGSTLALENPFLVVGAPGTDSGAGAAFVHIRMGNTWANHTTLSLSELGPNAAAGSSVDLDYPFIAIGAQTSGKGGQARQGAVAIFQRQGAQWTKHAVLTAVDGAPQSYFGHALALHGHMIAAASGFHSPPHYPGGATDQGLILTYRKRHSEWRELARVTAGDGGQDDTFHVNLAMAQYMLVAGASRDDAGGNANQGAIYIYKGHDNGWFAWETRTAAGGAAGDRFGIAVAVEPDGLAAGAPSHQGRGAVYVSRPRFVQRIAFSPLPDRTLSEGSFSITATASSALPVVIRSNTPAVCTVSGLTVTLVATGTCTLVASQAGDATFFPAPDIERPFQVFQTQPAGILGPQGGVLDDPGTGLSFGVAPGVLGSDTYLFIDAMPAPALDPPTGTEIVSAYIDVTLVPDPGTLPDTGAILSLPLHHPPAAGSTLQLHKLNPTTGQLVATGIAGVVDSSGQRASFAGVRNFSVFVALEERANIPPAPPSLLYLPLVSK